VSGLTVSSGGTFIGFGNAVVIAPQFLKGATVEVANGFVFDVDVRNGVTERVLFSGTAIVSAGGLLAADFGGTATIDGVAINSGALLASAGSSLIDIAGVVSGGAVSIGDGTVEVEAGGTANVIFLSSGIGGLEIADTASNTTAFTGTVSGFGGVGHTNQAQFIDLLLVTSDATVSVNFVAAVSHTSGALMVSSGGQLVANIDLVGVYSTGDFRLSSGVSGTVKISDPAVVGGGSVDTSSAAMVWLRKSVDRPGVGAGARTTLAGPAQGDKTGDIPTGAAGTTAIALLGNYMAASFVGAAPTLGGTSVESEAAGPPHLTRPHP
jgi:hypothetical protein